MQKMTWLPVIVLTTMNPAMATAAAPESLDGSAWILAGLPPDPLLEDTVVTLAFDSGRVAGTDGCNRYHGAYEWQDGTLRIGKLASSMMACPEPVMVQARRFTSALGLARDARIDEEALELVDAGGQVVARFGPQPLSLANSRWRVTGYNNGKQAVVSTAQGTSLTLEFDGAGNVSGSAGCNDYRAGYTAESDSIRIGEVAATRRLCENAVMTQEDAFLRALENCTTHRIEGARLEMRDEDGALQVVATRVDQG